MACIQVINCISIYLRNFISIYVDKLILLFFFTRVSTNQDLVTVLKWDLSGEKLIIADCTGLVQLWRYKDNVLNNWHLITSHCFIGEHILDIAWFHNGKRVSMFLMY